MESIGVIMATSLKSIKATAISPVLTTAGASSGVKITSITYANSATAANPAGGETVTVTGSGFNSGAKVYIDTLECATTFVSATSLTFTTPVKTVASYMLYVYNTDGSSGVYPVGLTYSSMPVWVTASGALTGAGINTSYSQAVSATGDGTVTYSVTSGSLPSGLSLNSSTGAITGTAPDTAGTSTFSITASDSQNQTVSRSFSISIASSPPSIEYLVVAGGGGGAGYGGGGGAGGLLTAAGYSVSPGNTITVTVGSGGAGGAAGANNPGIVGTDSIFGTVTSKGGGGGGIADHGIGGNGGSGGGGGAGPGSVVTNYGNAVYPGSSYLSQPRQGYIGGSGGGGGNYHHGGGGGAGAGGRDGGTGEAGLGGNGGVGLASSITGSSVYYAGGGGGNGFSGTQGTGGTGGGASATSGLAGVSGTVNTGGGGSGGGYTSGPLAGGSGGSGVVIIRYLDSYGPATSTTGSPTITNPTGYRVYKWTSSGSITF